MGERTTGTRSRGSERIGDVGLRVVGEKLRF